MSASEGFSRRQRLLNGAEFEAVMDYRCAVRWGCFLVMGRPNDVGHARLGMIVSRRLASRSVDRNRTKRLIRETFRRAASALPGLDLVVRPYALPHGKAFAEDLRVALRQVADKCGAR